MSESRLKVIAPVESLCPPCEYFEPELVDRSISWEGPECDRSVYAVDCRHRKVCKSRHELRKL